MGRPDKPAISDFIHNKKNTFICVIRSRPVVKHKQNPGNHLNDKEKKRQPAEIIPDRMPVSRHLL